jgi:hypothetical protein
MSLSWRDHFMPGNKDINEILERIKDCHDPVEKRKLLAEINPCKTCDQKGQYPHGNCDGRCLQDFQRELFNSLEHLKSHSSPKKNP